MFLFFEENTIIIGVINCIYKNKLWSMCFLLDFAAILKTIYIFLKKNSDENITWKYNK